MNKEKKKRVFGFVGPTASGKTALSLHLAQIIHGEILCMDSMQVYRLMDIGTAKPTLSERAVVPHHLFDVVDPSDNFAVTDYTRLAQPLLQTISAPILVGGTGLYLRALSMPLNFGFVKGDETLRNRYLEIATIQGNQELHAQLMKCDPVTAQKLHPNDIRRVSRALEVYDLTGIPFSAQVMPSYDDGPYTFSLFAIDMPRELLYSRINDRVDQMMKEGLLDEVRSLMKLGISPNAQAMKGLGYKELIRYLNGDMSLNESVEYLKQKTRNYAKRQLTWFRTDERIHWISYDEKSTNMKRMLEQLIEELN